MDLVVDGISIPAWLPVLAGLVVAVVMAPAGVSGAFLLLPFQVSVLGLVSTAVTPTNHLYNVVAVPAAAFRYARERRMVWPLAGWLALGTAPGALAGALIRLTVLSGMRPFKLFVGVVLLLLAGRIFAALRLPPAHELEPSTNAHVVQVRRSTVRRLEFEYGARIHVVQVPALLLLAAGLGLVGGAYGVGGGALLAPILVSVLGLPVHAVAGATLLTTWVTSMVSVGAFALAPMLGHTAVTPFWWLGLLMGVGGVVGMDAGARLQRVVSARLIQLGLAVVAGVLGGSYVLGFFR